MAVAVIGAKFFVLLFATFVCIFVGNFIDWVRTNVRRIFLFHFTSTIAEWVFSPGVCECGVRGPRPLANPTVDVRAFTIIKVVAIVSECPDNFFIIVRVGLGSRW